MARRSNKEYEALIQKHMSTLKCSREEAIDLIECDDEIDSGNKELFALTDEQKKIVRSVTKADKDPTKKRTVKRERKIDEDKKHIFDILKIVFEGYNLNGEIEMFAPQFSPHQIGYKQNGDDKPRDKNMADSEYRQQHKWYDDQ